MAAGNYQLLIDLLADKDLSLEEAVSGSGILKDIDLSDAAPLVHAAAVLRDTDRRILEDIREGLDEL